ncbi:MAG: hypothetical protein WBN09_06920 [Woeseiaceae bacterium]
MTIEQKYIDLINADIDGEISKAEKVNLDAFLAESAEGRAMHAELSELGRSLDAVEQLQPPPFLRQRIMNSLPQQQQQSGNFLQDLLAMPVLRYAASFVAGAFLAMSVVGSNTISETVFDDMGSLVGTMTDPASLGPAADSVDITSNEIAGTVSLRSAGSMLVLDFDLVSGDAVEIIADYTDKSIWFNGFAQLESSGTSISAETGRVKLQMQGKRRYAVFLQNNSDRQTRIDLKFLSGNQILHESSLNYGGAKR